MPNNLCLSLKTTPQLGTFKCTFKCTNASARFVCTHLPCAPAGELPSQLRTMTSNVRARRLAGLYVIDAANVIGGVFKGRAGGGSGFDLCHRRYRKTLAGLADTAAPLLQRLTCE